jgi:hypothetical protein
VTALLSLAGLGFYALLRVAYMRFYAPFGLSPDDLGLGYAQLLAQAAIGVILLLAAAGLVIALLVGLYVKVLTWIGLAHLVELFSDRLRRWIWSRGFQRALAVVGILVAILVAAGCAVGLYGYRVIALLILVAAGSAGLRRIWQGVMGARAGPVNWWRRGVAVIVVLAFAAAADMFIETADQNAKATRNGQPGHPAWYGIQLTTWGSDAATLAWSTESVDPAIRYLASSCLMYLGESDGTLFVYLPDSPGPATFRIPASAATVRVIPGRRCRPGVPVPTR